MVLWQGLTEGGTAVPVQVTEAGKVVAEGQQGQEGPPGSPGPPGPPGPQGEYGPGDDVDLGKITATGTIRAGGEPWAGEQGAAIAVGTVQGTHNAGSAVWRGGLVGGSTTSSITADGSITAIGNANFGLNSGSVAQDKEGIGLNGAGTVSTYVATTSVANTNAFAVLRSTAAGGGAVWSVKKDGSIEAAGNQAGFTVGGELYFTSRGTRYKLEVAGGLCNAIPYTREMQLKENVQNLRKPRTTDSVPED